MGQTEYADSFVQSMFSWIRWFANQITNIFQSNQNVGTDGMIGWFAANWLKILLILIVTGVVIDWLVWMIRWRPYWLWFRKKRVVLDDDFDDYLDETFNAPDEGDFFEEDSPLPDEREKHRFHSHALRKRQMDVPEDEFDDLWDENAAEDNYVEDDYAEDDFRDDMDDDAFDDGFGDLNQEIYEQPEQKQQNWADDFDDENLWGEPTLVKGKEPRPKKGLLRGITFRKNALPSPQHEAGEPIDEFDDFFKMDAQSDDEDMLIDFSSDSEPAEYLYEEADSYAESDEDFYDDTALDEQADRHLGNLSEEFSASSLYARPDSQKPFTPVSGSQEDEPWRTGYTVKVPKIDKDTEGLSRKARRKMRELDEE